MVPTSSCQAFSSPWNTTMFILAAFWVPLYREFHFYFAHRFIHIKVSIINNFNSNLNFIPTKALYNYTKVSIIINFNSNFNCIPTKALYKYVHSLHHRNTDIEPFAGLCMHPIEHLYYYRWRRVGRHICKLYTIQKLLKLCWTFPACLCDPVRVHVEWSPPAYLARCFP